MAFADNNNVLYDSNFQLSETSEMKCQLMENKRSGNISLSIREFINKENYSGPGKNGMFLRVSNIEDIEKLQNEFNTFFDNAKKYLS